jgi:hypothetical protein
MIGFLSLLHGKTGRSLAARASAALMSGWFALLGAQITRRLIPKRSGGWPGV